MPSFHHIALAFLALSPVICNGQTQQTKMDLLRVDIAKLKAIHCEESTTDYLSGYHRREMGELCQDQS